MLAHSVFLRAPKLLSCTIAEEALASASTASGKLTPCITNITLRLRRNGPSVSYDLRLSRDKRSGKLYLNELPDFIASHSLALATFFPLNNSQAPENALCVVMVNGEVLQGLSAKELQNVFRKGNDLTMQLTVEPESYSTYHRLVANAGAASARDDVARRDGLRKKNSAKLEGKTRKKASRAVDEEDAEDGDDNDEDADEGDEEEDIVETRKKSRKSAVAKQKVKAAAKSHHKKHNKADGRRIDRKRKPRSGKRTAGYDEDDAEDDNGVGDEEDDDEPPRKTPRAKAKALRKAKTSHKKATSKKIVVRDADDEESAEDEADEDNDTESEQALIDLAVERVQRSAKTNKTTKEDDTEGDEEEPWFRPAKKTSAGTSSPTRAMVQF